MHIYYVINILCGILIVLQFVVKNIDGFALNVFIFGTERRFICSAFSVRVLLRTTCLWLSLLLRLISREGDFFGWGKTKRRLWE